MPPARSSAASAPVPPATSSAASAPVPPTAALRGPRSRPPRPAARTAVRQLRPPTPSARLAEMARAFAVLFLEVEAGARPRWQLRPLMTPVLFARVSRVWVRPHLSPGRLGRILGDQPVEGRYEAVATVHRPGRSSALAFRLQAGPGGWRVDDLARPEDGPLPDPPAPWPDDDPSLTSPHLVVMRDAL